MRLAGSCRVYLLKASYLKDRLSSTARAPSPSPIRENCTSLCDEPHLISVLTGVRAAASLVLAGLVVSRVKPVKADLPSLPSVQAQTRSLLARADLLVRDCADGVDGVLPAAPVPGSRALPGQPCVGS